MYIYIYQKKCIYMCVCMLRYIATGYPAQISMPKRDTLLIVEGSGH